MDTQLTSEAAQQRLYHLQDQPAHDSISGKTPCLKLGDLALIRFPSQVLFILNNLALNYFSHAVDERTFTASIGGIWQFIFMYVLCSGSAVSALTLFLLAGLPLSPFLTALVSGAVTLYSRFWWHTPTRILSWSRGTVATRVRFELAQYQQVCTISPSNFPQSSRVTSTVPMTR